MLRMAPSQGDPGVTPVGNSGDVGEETVPIPRAALLSLKAVRIVATSDWKAALISRRFCFSERTSSWRVDSRASPSADNLEETCNDQKWSRSELDTGRAVVIGSHFFGSNQPFQQPQPMVGTS